MKLHASLEIRGETERIFQQLHASLEIRGETERIFAVIKYRYVQISNTIGNQI